MPSPYLAIPANEFSLVALDFPGFGQSEAQSDLMTPVSAVSGGHEDPVEDVDGVVDDMEEVEADDGVRH
jgi:hypothetical protein